MDNVTVAQTKEMSKSRAYLHGLARKTLADETPEVIARALEVLEDGIREDARASEIWAGILEISRNHRFGVGGINFDLLQKTIRSAADFARREKELALIDQLHPSWVEGRLPEKDEWLALADLRDGAREPSFREAADRFCFSYDVWRRKQDSADAQEGFIASFQDFQNKLPVYQAQCSVELDDLSASSDWMFASLADIQHQPGVVEKSAQFGRALGGALQGAIRRQAVLRRSQAVSFAQVMKNASGAAVRGVANGAVGAGIRTVGVAQIVAQGVAHAGVRTVVGVGAVGVQAGGAAYGLVRGAVRGAGRLPARASSASIKGQFLAGASMAALRLHLAGVAGKVKNAVAESLLVLVPQPPVALAYAGASSRPAYQLPEGPSLTSTPKASRPRGWEDIAKLVVDDNAARAEDGLEIEDGQDFEGGDVPDFIGRSSVQEGEKFRTVAATSVGSGAARGRAWGEKALKAAGVAAGIAKAAPGAVLTLGCGFIKSMNEQKYVTAFGAAAGFGVRHVLAGAGITAAGVGLPAALLLGGVSGIIGGAVRYEYNCLRHDNPAMSRSAASFRAIRRGVASLGSGAHWGDLKRGFFMVPGAYREARAYVAEQNAHTDIDPMGRYARQKMLVRKVFAVMKEKDAKAASLATSVVTGMLGGVIGFSLHDVVQPHVDPVLHNVAADADVAAESVSSHATRAFDSAVLWADHAGKSMAGDIMHVREVGYEAFGSTPPDVAVPASAPVEMAALVPVVPAVDPLAAHLAEIAAQTTDQAKISTFVLGSDSFKVMVNHVEQLEVRGVLKGDNLRHFYKLIGDAQSGNLVAAKELSDSISEGGVFDKAGFHRIAHMPIDRLGTAAAAKVGFPGGVAKNFVADLQNTLGQGPAALQEARNGKLIDVMAKSSDGLKPDGTPYGAVQRKFAGVVNAAPKAAVLPPLEKVVVAEAPSIKAI